MPTVVTLRDNASAGRKGKRVFARQHNPALTALPGKESAEGSAKRPLPALVNFSRETHPKPALLKINRINSDR